MCLVNMSNDSRVMVFIDLRNIIKGAKNTVQGPYNVDFVTLAKKLSDGRKLVGAYCFDGCGISAHDDNARSMQNALRYDGFRVIVRNSYDNEDHAQKEVDVAMALEIYKQALNNAFDVAVIVSGDGDFVPVVEAVQGMGKIVQVASFNSNINTSMIRAADMFLPLDSMPIMAINPRALEAIGSENNEEAAEENAVETTDGAETAEAM